MNRFKKWLSGIGIGIAALFGVHKIQPVQIETGLPTQVQTAPTPIAPFNTGVVGKPKLIPGSVQSLDSEQEMIREGFLDANKVNASDCYKDAILKSNFTENQGLTPSEIYDLQASHEVTVNVIMFDGTYWQNYITKTVGYENEPGTVYMNRHFVDSAYLVADNLEHEGLGHSVGFTHYGTKRTSEPYGENDIFEKCAPSVGIRQ